MHGGFGGITFHSAVLSDRLRKLALYFNAGIEGLGAYYSKGFCASRQGAF